MILGEYHHVDYKEKRRNQLEKDRENLESLSDDFQGSVVNRLSSKNSSL